MITVIRRGMKTKAYKILLLIIALALAGAFSLPGIIKMAIGRTEWLIKVDNTYIDKNEFARATMGQQELVEAFKAYYGENAHLFAQLMGVVLDPQVLAFDKIVRDALLNKVTDALGIAIDDDYVTKQLHNVSFLQQEAPELVPRYVIGPQGIEMNRLRAYLQRIGLTIADFESRIEQAIARSMTLAVVNHAGYVLESEVKERFIQQNMGKKFSFLMMPMSTFLKEEKEKPVSKEELKTFFDAKNSQEKRYLIPEKRAGITWEFSPESYDISISDDDVTTYYNNNKTHYFVETPTQVVIRRIVFENPQEAEQARKSFLTNPDSFAKQAEELPSFSRNTHQRDFEKAAFLLKNDGDFSEIIKTDNGFELLQRVSRKAQTYKPISLVRNEIISTLRNRIFEKKFEKDIEQIKRKALQNSDAWQDFIKEKKAIRKTIEFINNDGSDMAQALFKLNKDGYTSYRSDNKGFIVRLNQVQKAHIPTLELLQNQVRDDLYAERAAQAMRDRFAQLKKEAQTIGLKELAKNLNMSIETTDWIRKNDEDTIKKLSSKDFPITQLLPIEKKGTTIEFITDQHGYLIRLDDIEPFDQQVFNEQKSQLLRLQMKENSQIEQQAFVASLYRNATIKTNESYKYVQQ